MIQHEHGFYRSSFNATIFDCPFEKLIFIQIQEKSLQFDDMIVIMIHVHLLVSTHNFCVHLVASNSLPLRISCLCDNSR